MRITTNLLAINTYNQYQKSSSQLTRSIRKLSSGYAINSAADDAAGLCISEKMRAQIRGLQVAKKNAQGAVSLLRTADSALGGIANILQRMRELAVQSSSGTNDDKTDREALQAEFLQLKEEIDDIATRTNYNLKELLDGSLSALKSEIDTNVFNDDMNDTLINASPTKNQPSKINGLVVQVGANAGEVKIINIERMDISNLGMAFANVGTKESATSTISRVDKAIEQVSSQRSYLGTMIKSFEDTANMNVETLAAAESRIRDVDIAKEMTNFTNAAILQQVSIALMVQAKSLPENVLTLIDGQSL